MRGYPDTFNALLSNSKLVCTVLSGVAYLDRPRLGNAFLQVDFISHICPWVSLLVSFTSSFSFDRNRTGTSEQGGNTKKRTVGSVMSQNRGLYFWIFVKHIHTQYVGSYPRTYRSTYTNIKLPQKKKLRFHKFPSIIKSPSIFWWGSLRNKNSLGSNVWQR